MSRFFIDRPIFAWVIAILLMGLGLLSIRTLPIAQFPEIAPPQVIISSTYPGASAATVGNTVTQVIEQQLTAIDGLIYMSSSSLADGTSTITVTFEVGSDPDIAQVQVQNKLSQALPLLPDEVQRQGITVQKASPGFLLAFALISPSGEFDEFDLADYIASNMEDEISRIPGVGSVTFFGSEYAMRIWLDPAKLQNYQLTADDIFVAVSEQNAQISAGSFGALPTVKGQELNATITAQSLLRTPEDFRQIVVKVETDGSFVLLEDVAEVELGAQDYSFSAHWNHEPSAGMGIALAIGANALDTAEAVKARLDEFAEFFPDGMEYVLPYDSTPFVRISIDEVVKTLFEAIGLVFLVMLLFLQNIRATLIPTIAVPVVLLGTFAILFALGFSINTLTMLAMVLAIGLLVDDAIVVVENVERIMEQEGLDPKEATRKSMDQISSALVGVAMVLSAVFFPMAFFGGSTGVIYKQFSITIISAMALSVFVALTLTPALCASMLKRRTVEKKSGGLFGPFNKGFSALQRGYGNSVGGVVRRPIRVGLIYVALTIAMVLLFARTPTGFLPNEDQGFFFVLVETPTGATMERTEAVLDEVQDYFLEHEADSIFGVYGIAGFSFAGNAQNTGMAFINLKPWSERTKPEQSAEAMIARAQEHFSSIQDAMVFPILPPAVISLGTVSGFDAFLQARGGQSHEQLLAARNQLMSAANQSPIIGTIRPNGLEDAPQYHMHIDYRKAGAMGLTAQDVGDLLNLAWAGEFVNEFVDEDRVKWVYIQGQADSRAVPSDLDKWWIRNAFGGLVPLSNFITADWGYGPQGVYRYNGVPAMELQGTPSSTATTGQAMAEMERLAAQIQGDYKLSWTSISYDEAQAGNTAPLLYALSLAAIFLSLAALYESWSIPFAVLLAMPLGVLGALIGAWLGGFDNGVFFQVGLLTVVGLTGKNAILIVEFARGRQAEGESVLDAVQDAARQRFRPIIMTSMAFSLGVLPLVLSSGAGAAGRQAIGSGVLGGTISATILGVLFVPLFFYIVAGLFRRKTTGQGSVAEPAE